MLSAPDLAEVLGAFNAVTAKVQASHEALRREVERLQGELCRANEQIERSRRLAALGEMAAGIAHEVRNPLGSIRLYARMLEDDLAGLSDQRALAVKIGSAVRTVDAVVRDVLEFAREERVRPELVEVSEMIDRAVGEALAADRGERSDGAPEIELRVLGSPSDSGQGVWCDPTLAHRAIGNVAGNAIQAMRERRTEAGCAPLVLTIRRSHQRVDSVGMDIIAVGDTGPGIRPDVMERMFNPFFTTRATGTGLGLSIVHRIMEAHGGSVLVRNRRGDGDVGTGLGAVVELRFPQVSGEDGAGRSERWVDSVMDGCVAMGAARGNSEMENAE